MSILIGVAHSSEERGACTRGLARPCDRIHRRFSHDDRGRREHTRGDFQDRHGHISIWTKSLLTGRFTLVSGAVSYCVGMKPTMFDPDGAHLVAEIIFDLLHDERDVDSMGFLE
jgi:hypothetical protein